jgi:hypothetical protein
VSKQDVIVFSAVGFTVWLAATLFYAAFGDGVLERAFWFYALNAFAAAGAAAFAFQATARLRRVPRGRRLFPALAFALPGLAGANLVLAHFAALTPAGPISAGRYGAFVAVILISVGASAFERGSQKARL